MLSRIRALAATALLVTLFAACAVEPAPQPELTTKTTEVGLGEQCALQEDCDAGLYCHIRPMWPWEKTEPVGECETTDPAGPGEVCNQYRDCRTGLRCCYPCGIFGCENVCMQPCDETEPYCFGGCPLLP